ncbi:MAG: hypothetical protein JST51_04320 [Armatimonadetes bacterium]|nr:hypothetical protein [Armatimonadota bacterium]
MSLGDMAGILVPIAALSIPVIKILTRHQAQMTQLIHSQGNLPQVQSDTSELREEVRQLRELMHQQAIAIDNLRDDIRSSNNVQARITENS